MGQFLLSDGWWQWALVAAVLLPPLLLPAHIAVQSLVNIALWWALCLIVALAVI